MDYHNYRENLGLGNLILLQEAQRTPGLATMAHVVWNWTSGR